MVENLVDCAVDIVVDIEVGCMVAGTVGVGCKVAGTVVVGSRVVDMVLTDTVGLRLSDHWQRSHR